jgi:hypothetical protein
MEKRKANPILPIFRPHWYNPIFWMIVLIAPFYCFFKDGTIGFLRTIEDEIKFFKECSIK